MTRKAMALAVFGSNDGIDSAVMALELSGLEVKWLSVEAARPRPNLRVSGRGGECRCGRSRGRPRALLRRVLASAALQVISALINVVIGPLARLVVSIVTDLGVAALVAL